MAQDVQAQVCATIPPDALHISKPRDGKTVIVHPNLARALAFDFNLDDVKVGIEGEDIRLAFGDGSQIILPGLGIDLAATEPPNLFFDCQLHTAQDLYAHVGQVEIADAYSPETLQTVMATNAIADESFNPNTSMAPSRVDALQQSEQRPIVLAESVAQPSVIPIYAPSGSPSINVNNTTIIINNGSATGNGTGSGTQLGDVAFKTYGYTDKSTDVVGGVTTIIGAAANASAKAPPLADGLGSGATLSELMESETLVGNDGVDRIFADPTVAGAGHGIIAPRVSMQLTGNTEGGTLEVKLPAGYRLLTSDTGFQAVSGSDGIYTLKFATAGSSITFDMDLVYAVPYGHDAADANGFYGPISQINYTFSPNGSSGVIHGALSVGVRDVSSQSDLSYTTADGSSVLVIPSVPAGNLISALAADDTIYAGAGADTIDGGTGTNTVSYAKSNGGVSVVLGEGGQAQVQQSLGYAKGDVILNIENIEGSVGNDSLEGDAGANTLAGGAGNDTLLGWTGNDTLDGGAGNDWYILQRNVSYTINDTQGSADRVLLSGSTYYNGLTMETNGTVIEQISDQNGNSAGTLIGDNSDNSIFVAWSPWTGGRLMDGSLGNDTMTGAAGNDVFRLNTADVNNGADRVTGNDGTDIGQFYNSNTTVGGPVQTVTLQGSALDVIFDTTEILDFKQANVAAGSSSTPILFSAADIQGIVGGASVGGGGNSSQLTINSDVSGAGRDFIGIAGVAGVTVKDAGGNVVATNANLGAGTYTFTNDTTHAVVAKLVLNAS